MIKPTKTVAAILSALFPTSEKAIAEKLTQEEFDAFAAETQETQNRLDAQTQGNTALAADLTKAQADLAAANATLATTQTELANAQSALKAATDKVTELTPKAAAWDAHKAALAGANVVNDTTNGKTKLAADLTAKDQAHVDRLTELKAKYPSLMADIDVPTATED